MLQGQGQKVQDQGLTSIHLAVVESGATSNFGHLVENSMLGCASSAPATSFAKFSVVLLYSNRHMFQRHFMRYYYVMLF